MEVLNDQQLGSCQAAKDRSLIDVTKLGEEDIVEELNASESR